MPPFPKIRGVKFAPLRDFAGYAASMDGRVWSCKERFGRGFVAWHEMGYSTNKHGYRLVDLYDGNGRRKMRLVGRVVLDAFTPCPDPKLEAAHIDWNPLNTALSNLQWMEMVHNRNRAGREGRMPRGEDRPNSKLTTKDVLLIYELGKKGIRHKVIGAKMNTSRENVRDILAGKRWKYLYHHYLGD